MKNIIEISQEGEQLISSIDINENTLYINNTLVPESQYIGSGTYTTTVEGHSISIVKVPNNTGNIQLVRLDEYSYSLKKADAKVLDHLSIDENGYLKISDMYFNTPSENGYIIDQYGNFIHSRNDSSDNWNIKGNDNTSHLKVYFETGKIFTDDALVTEDSTGFEYPLIWDNGANLWIGSTMTATKHHTGATYISSGYTGHNGNSTAFISVPNSDNTGATNYGILHEGNFPDANVTRTFSKGTSNNNTNNSTTPKDLLTINHKSNTGKVVVIGKIPLLTNNQTSSCRITVNGTEVAYSVTNATVVQQITLFGSADVTKGSTVPIKLQFTPQSGSIATVPAYNAYALMAFDLAVI